MRIAGKAADLITQNVLMCKENQKAQMYAPRLRILCFGVAMRRVLSTCRRRWSVLACCKSPATSTNHGGSQSIHRIFCEFEHARMPGASDLSGTVLIWLWGIDGIGY